MKKVLLISLLTNLFMLFTQAQGVGVEKSVWGIQTGLAPLAVYKETRLTNCIALRSEISFGFAFAYSMGESKWAFIPGINLAPRYYYNLEKRASKGKQTAGNSGNFIALNLGYVPGLAIQSSNAEIDPSLHIIPTWGIRRNIGTSFNYEIAFGIGYGATFEEYTSYFGNGETVTHTEHGVAYALRLAIGYKF